MKRVRFVLLWLLAAGFPLFAQTNDSPAQAVRGFYAEYQKLHSSGLPDQAVVRKLGSHWSAGLRAAISRAQAEQGGCKKSHPGDKPPWVEGDMFSSNFEGFTTVRVQDPASPGNGRLTLTFEYSANGKKVSWSDDVSVIREGGRWVIDDVFYRHQQDFGNGFGISLRSSLEAKGC